MIKIQYVADLPIKRFCNCDSCGKSVEHDTESVRVDMAYGFHGVFFILCSDCRRELYEKI